MRSVTAFRTSLFSSSPRRPEIGRIGPSDSPRRQRVTAIRPVPRAFFSTHGTPPKNAFEKRQTEMNLKLEQLAKMAAPSSPEPPPIISSSTAEEETTPEQKAETLLQLLEKRSTLKIEATKMTLALWRTCLRCSETMRAGNAQDEVDFKKRDEAQKESVSLFEPPVDRENELQSRANYYVEWAKEHIVQESDCLDGEGGGVWSENDVRRYVHFLKLGEHKRKWVLENYRFEDDYEDSFDLKRLERFDEEASRVSRDIYEVKGWERDEVIEDFYQ